MTLAEKISLVDRMIKEDPDATIKDYLLMEAIWKPAAVSPEAREAPVVTTVVRTVLFERYRPPFIYGYMELIKQLVKKYKATEDQIVTRPKAVYSNRSALGIANEMNLYSDNYFFNDNH
jgi:hypothetical protein